MNSATIVYGNLALQQTVQETAPAFTVVSGGGSAELRFSRASGQVSAPDVYARCSPCPTSRSRALVFGIAATVLIAVCLASAFTLGRARAERQDAFIDSLSSQAHVVEAGQSLWDIAREHPVEGLPTSESVELIKAWNDLAGTVIQPGMELAIPVTSA